MNATIQRGAKTNRVKVGRSRRSIARIHETSPQRAKARYAKDPSVRDRLYVVIAVSMPVDELVEIDTMSERIHMNRSAYLRRAALMLAAFVDGDDATFAQELERIKGARR